MGPVLSVCSLGGQFVHVVYIWRILHDHACVGKRQQQMHPLHMLNMIAL